MKNLIKMLAVAAVVVFAGNASAQTAIGTASANIISPIAITNGATNLVFGNILANATGTVAVADAGTKFYSIASMAPNGNQSSSSTDNGPSSAAAFNVTGGAGLTFTVSNSTVTYGSSPSWTTAPSMSLVINNEGPLTLSGTGTASFTEGGTLSVPSGKPVGSYSATWVVTVAYN